ncbi:type II toxin-antitoxin system Phd/YefM family antitoxin [Kineococcus glutinatus]|uniref:Prevent-host-death family protein n=1 Tax=Kineococcus glutinatus TaxID=1070872 RepID=A0ABP9I080_9ACTN
MGTISQRELRNDSGGVLRRLQAGESFTITVHGKPIGVLRLDPVPTGPQRTVHLDNEPAIPGHALTPEERAAWKADIARFAEEFVDDDLDDPYERAAARRAQREQSTEEPADKEVK